MKRSMKRSKKNKFKGDYQQQGTKIGKIGGHKK